MTIIWDPAPASDAQIEEHLGGHAGLAFVDRSRLSRLLCDQLVCGIGTRTLDSFAVTDVIQALEGLAPAGREVDAGPFKYVPLRGLRHAHFFQASFIGRNLQEEFKRKDSARLRETLELEEEPKQQAIDRAAYAMTIGLFEKRAHRKGRGLTGEWLIYANCGGANFYLAVAGHDEGGQVIYDRIMARCEERFRDVVIAATRQG